MFKRIALALIAAIVLSSCGEQAREELSTSTALDTIVISPLDTIGVLTGDSNYVFGTIGDAIYTEEGNIAVLDESACCVKVYDPSGQFLMQIGRRGSGPGEFLNPGGMVLLSDGRIGVLDQNTGGLHSYMTNGVFDSLLIDFHGMPVPQWAWGVDSLAFVGAITDFQQEDDGMTVRFLVGRWELSTDPEVIYFTSDFPFNPQDMASFLEKTFFSCTYAADRDGYVYVSPISSSNYLIDVYEPDGTLYSTISRNMPRIQKTQKEIDDETAMVTTILTERGMPENMIDYRPDQYRWMIQPQGMGADGQGRIWVHSGSADGIIMDVYSREGDHLAVVRIDGVENRDMADFVNVKVQPQGILAYSLQDLSYPRLFVLPMPEL